MPAPANEPAVSVLNAPVLAPELPIGVGAVRKLLSTPQFMMWSSTPVPTRSRAWVLVGMQSPESVAALRLVKAPVDGVALPISVGAVRKLWRAIGVTTLALAGGLRRSRLARWPPWCR